MSKDKLIKVTLLIGSIAIMLIHLWLGFPSAWTLIVLQITVFIAITAIFDILVWISHTPPKTY